MAKPNLFLEWRSCSTHPVILVPVLATAAQLRGKVKKELTVTGKLGNKREGAPPG